MIERRLKELAADSEVGKPGFLDLPAHHLKDMPSDLKLMRRIRIGRHRVFYKGNYNQCSFTVFYIKIHKKKGVKDESDQLFQTLLAGVIGEPTTRLLREPEKPAESQVAPATQPEQKQKRRQRKRSRGK
jgi:hypothetical protein